MGEFFGRNAWRYKGIDLVRFVGPSERQATHQHLAFTRTDVRQDDAVEVIPSSLWASVQTTRARCQHDVLHKHAVIEHRASTHDGVQSEHHANRRVEEFVIALVLQMHLVFVALANT